MSSLRIGLAGAGLIGIVHSAMLREIADRRGLPIELAAVADPDELRRLAFVKTFGYRGAFADAHEMLAAADLDAIYVCTPTSGHVEIALAAASRGVHLFCEKPLAMTCADAERIAAAAEQAGVRAQVGLVLRFSPVYALMRSLIHDPASGSPMAVVFRDDQCFPIRGTHDTAWRADRSRTAGGTIIEHGIHDLDLLVWMFGPVARLRAFEQNRAGHPGVEDYMAVELLFESGLRAQLVNVWHDVGQRASNRRLEVFCQRAFVASDHDMSGPVVVQRGDGAEETIAADQVLARFERAPETSPLPPGGAQALPYFLQALAFVRALLEDRAPEPDLRSGVAAQQLAAAVYHAAASGEEVALREFRADPASGH